VIGKTVSHYKIVSKLGEGGMGVVYEARDTRLDRHVALKFLPASLGTQDAAKKRFIHEAKAASSLEHPNICAVYDIGETDDGQMFIAMPRYDGETLEERIARGPMEIGEAIDMVTQLAAGLAKAHERGIVHRDIKPGNIFVTRDGHVKIMDFGLAKLATETRLTKSGTTVGTISYMSPEQASGGDVDARSDIFSAGVVLYEMLTGRRPFRGDHDAAVIYGIIHNDPDPLQGLPEGVQQIVDTALAKVPGARFPSAVELEKALREVSTRSATVPPLRRRSKLLVAFIASLVLVAAVGTAVVERSAIREWVSGRSAVSPKKSSLAVLYFQNFGASGDDDYLAGGFTEEVITTLAGIPGLHVTSRAAVARYRGKEIDPREIGQTLDVGYVLEGSIQRSSDALRVTAQLINTRDGFHVWSESYDGTMADLFAVQDSMANQIARSLQAVIGGKGFKVVSRRWTRNPEAYAAFLTGRELYHARPAPEDAPHIRRWYQKALDLDPNYAPAMAGEAHLLIAQYIDGHRAPGLLDEALQLAQRAEEIDPALAIAWRAEGRVHRARGELEKAKEVLERAVQLSPNLGIVHYTLSRIYRDMGQRDKALEIALRGLEVDPGDPRMYYNVSVRYRDWARYAEAEAVIARGLEKFPDEWSILREKVYLMNAQRRYQEAMNTLERWVRVDPRSGVYRRIGDCFDALGMPAQADSIFDLIVERWPDLAVALNASGFHELSRGRNDAAESLLTRAIEIDPDYYWARLNLARCYAAQNRTKDAERALSDMANHWPDDFDNYARIGQFYRVNLKQYDRAEEWLRKSIRLNPRFEFAQHHLAWAFMGRGQYEKAAKEFQSAIDLRHDAYWDYCAMSNALVRAGRVPESIDAARRAVELKPDDVRSLFQLGVAYSTAGESHRAASAWERALDVDSTHVNSLSNLAAVYREEGRPQRAMEMLRRATRVDTTAWGPWYQIADIEFRESGNLDEAREAARTAIRKAKGNTYAESAGYETLGMIEERRGDRDAANRAYGDALERIDRELEERPDDVTFLAMAGYARARTGDTAKARHYAEWLAENEKTADGLYNAACIMALSGDREQALEYLASAVAMGYHNGRWMATDLDLKTVRDDPRFKKLLASLR
jgi:serine/threonine protein kinase/tetratricopeptide (TPR) repeat protein